jgi:hypothetical protein
MTQNLVIGKSGNWEIDCQIERHRVTLDSQLPDYQITQLPDSVVRQWIVYGSVSAKGAISTSKCKPSAVTI